MGPAKESKLVPFFKAGIELKAGSGSRLLGTLFWEECLSSPSLRESQVAKFFLVLTRLGVPPIFLSSEYKLRSPCSWFALAPSINSWGWIMAWLLLGNGTSECYYFHENCFLVGTLGKACLQGSDLLVQQHFRWVQLRWDCEPIQGLLQRFLRRKVMNKVTSRSRHLPRREGDFLPGLEFRIQCGPG